MFEVVLSPEAQAFFAASDRPVARKLARCFAQLERQPRRHNNIKRLSGKLAGRLRYRLGDWRVFIGSTTSHIASWCFQSPIAAKCMTNGKSTRPPLNSFSPFLRFAGSPFRVSPFAVSPFLVCLDWARIR